MKIELTCAIVALLGYSTTQAIAVNTNKYIMQRTENGTIFKIGKYDSDSSESDADDSLVGLDEEDDGKDHSSELYYAGSSGVRPDGSEYVRVIPD